MILKCLATLFDTTAAAQVAAAPIAGACFTVPEMKALAGLITGPALGGIASRCSAFPTSTPALTAARGSLLGRFKVQADAAGPVVGIKLAAVMGLAGAGATQSADVFTPIVALVATQMATKLAEKECRLIDDIVGTLLPLDDARVVTVVGGMLTAIGRDPRQDILRLCDVTAH